jgi:hypothetical protein
MIRPLNGTNLDVVEANIEQAFLNWIDLMIGERVVDEALI